MSKKENMAAIVFHGFNSCSNDVKFLADYLNNRGIYTIYPNLAGKKGSKREWNTTTWEDWIYNAEKEFIKLKKKFRKVSTIGFSMGGLVAAHVTYKYEANLLTLVNTPIYCGDRNKIIRNIKMGVIKRNYEPIISYYNIINETPIRGLLYLIKGLNKTLPLVEKIKAPMLIIQGLKDEAVSWKSADYLFNHCGSFRKKKIYYRNANHFIFESEEKEDVCKEIFHYLLQNQ